jgi:hypothetical protein
MQPLVDPGHIGLGESIGGRVAQLRKETDMEVRPKSMTLHIGVDAGERTGHDASSRARPRNQAETSSSRISRETVEAQLPRFLLRILEPELARLQKVDEDSLTRRHVLATFLLSRVIRGSTYG